MPRTALLAVLVAALALAGCAPDVADRTYRGLPEEPAPTPAPFESGGPAIQLVDDGDVLAVTTVGSSTCPVHAEDVDWGDDATVRITFRPSRGEICTADLSPTTHEFAVPDRLRGRPLEVELASTDSSDVDRYQVG